MFLQRCASLEPRPTSFTASKGQLRDVDGQDAKAIDRAVFERVGFVARLLEVVRRERAGVDDEQATGLENLGVHLERGGVHRHQYVGCVTRRLDVVRGEVDLEARDPVGGSGRRADLRGKVRERRKIVSGVGCGRRELATRELHPVAGVAGEANDNGV